MKKHWQAIGITVIAAGLLYYPALRLYKYLTSRADAPDDEEDKEEHRIKAFVPAYRGKHKHPHHRPTSDGQG
jgi:hypothetical protein